MKYVDPTSHDPGLEGSAPAEADLDVPVPGIDSQRVRIDAEPVQGGLDKAKISGVISDGVTTFKGNKKEQSVKVARVEIKSNEKGQPSVKVPVGPVNVEFSGGDGKLKTEASVDKTTSVGGVKVSGSAKVGVIFDATQGTDNEGSVGEVTVHESLQLRLWKFIFGPTRESKNELYILPVVTNDPNYQAKQELWRQIDAGAGSPPVPAPSLGEYFRDFFRPRN